MEDFKGKSPRTCLNFLMASRLRKSVVAVANEKIALIRAADSLFNLEARLSSVRILLKRPRGDSPSFEVATRSPSRLLLYTMRV